MTSNATIFPSIFVAVKQTPSTAIESFTSGRSRLTPFAANPQTHAAAVLARPR